MKPYLSYRPTSSESAPYIPSHWTLNRLKHVLILAYGDALAADIRVDGSIKVYGSNGPVGTHAISNTGCPVVVVGRKGSYGKVNFSKEPIFCIDTAYHVSQSACGVDLKFMYYAMQSLGLDGMSQDTGVSGLSREVAYQQPIPTPPDDEQIAIAAYLDVETSRIDSLHDEKNRLIDLLFEFRRNVILEHISGINRNNPRRATGNTFLPTVPAGWDFVSIRRYAKITNGCTPLKDDPNFWSGGTFPWLNSAVVNRDEVTEGSEFVTEAALRLCHLPIVPPGSVLVALTGQGKTRGQAAVLRIEATINQHLAAIVCDDEEFDSEFLFWTLIGQYHALRMISDGQGGTKGALTCDELARFQVPKPPLTEQRIIAGSIREETRQIDCLIYQVRGELSLLQELRYSTIKEAVTGRIDVRSLSK